MNIAVFTENMLGSSGGAEVYALKLAEILNKKNVVTIFTITNDLCKKDPSEVYRKYNILEMPVKTIELCHSKNFFIEIPNRIIFWAKLKRIINKKYDLFINCSHNRMFGFKKTKSIHLIHFPLKNYSTFFPFGIGKLLDVGYKNSYKGFISNSSFTQYHLKKEWGCDSTIINPPISMIPLKEEELSHKENVILMVGRIVPDKQFLDILEFFVQNKENETLRKYKLMIIGNKDSEYDEYFDKVKSYENLISLEVLTDVPFEELLKWYKKSKIFLHAKGYRQKDENPILMEHFGMTTVEAMANGCIPIVINKAGQKEIVQNEKNGFLWNETSQILIALEKLEKVDISLIQKEAISRSELYLEEQFEKNVNKYFGL